MIPPAPHFDDATLDEPVDYCDHCGEELEAVDYLFFTCSSCGESFDA